MESENSKLKAEIDRLCNQKKRWKWDIGIALTLILAAIAGTWTVCSRLDQIEITRLQDRLQGLQENPARLKEQPNLDRLKVPDPDQPKVTGIPEQPRDNPMPPLETPGIPQATYTRRYEVWFWGYSEKEAIQNQLSRFPEMEEIHCMVREGEGEPVIQTDMRIRQKEHEKTEDLAKKIEAALSDELKPARWSPDFRKIVFYKR